MSYVVCLLSDTGQSILAGNAAYGPRTPDRAEADAFALLRELDLEVDIFQAAQYADSTKKSITTAQKSYEGFCVRTGRWPDPATGISSLDFNRYIVLMARTRKYKTVLNYITMGVRTWHLDHGIPYVPSHDRTDVVATLKGLRRTKGDAQNQKLPLTLRILEEIHTTMDGTKATHMALWAAYLICFFCLLRKGQVTATRARTVLSRTHIYSNGRTSC